MDGQEAELRAERDLRRLGLAGGPRGPRLRDREPGHPGGDERGGRVGEERRGEAPVGGEQPAGEGADPDREDEHALVDRHHAAAIGRRGDVREHDQAGGEHEGGARAGHEARADERGIGRGDRAEHVAEGRHEAADRERRAAPERVREAAGGHRDQEAREPVHRDGEADGGLRDAEGARVEGERGHDAAEAELVHRDEHAHPRQDARTRGGWHDRSGVSRIAMERKPGAAYDRAHHTNRRRSWRQIWRRASRSSRAWHRRSSARRRARPRRAASPRSG